MQPQISKKEKHCQNCESYIDGFCKFLDRDLTKKERWELPWSCEMWICKCWRSEFNEKFIERALLWYDENFAAHPDFFSKIIPIDRDKVISYSKFRAAGSIYDQKIIEDMYKEKL